MYRLIVNLLTKHAIDGYLVPCHDKYQVFVPNNLLYSVTGFSGSWDLVIVFKDHGWFFTDGRYTVQAKMEIDQEFFVVKDYQDLADMSLEGMIIGYDPELLSQKQVESLKFKTLAIESPIRKDYTSLDRVVFVYPDNNYQEKLIGIRNSIEKLGVDHCLLTSVDSVSWLLNLRSDVVPNSGVILAYALINKDELIIFTNMDIKLKGAKLLKMHHAIGTLLNLKGKIMLSKATCPASIFRVIKDHQLVEGDPCSIKKAKKTPSEIASFKQVNLKDSIVLCEFFAWLEESLVNKVTEYDLSKKLTELRKEQSGYISDSFPAICGYLENSSIIHYKPTKAGAKVVCDNGILLVDSGGHYLGGTTDVTRTLTLGSPTHEQILMYTTVLKGHLRLGAMKFPRNTTGANLDAIARMFLWSLFKDYPHSTGHGVGNLLNVHEGPCGISSKNHTPLEEGMILSNEPGFYESFGIRIENLIYVKQSQNNFLEFENLTLVPYCRELINYELLDKTEIEFLKNYYENIKEEVLPYLSTRAAKWALNQILP